MAVQGDEVATRIETHIREAIDRMVREIRASVEDVRVAVDQQLEAALQSVQADANAVSFGPQIRQFIHELEDEADKPAPLLPPPLPRADASGVRTALQAVEGGRSQVDVLVGMLEQCLAFSSRAALLILKGETFNGWKGAGFSAHGDEDEAIKRFNVSPNGIPEFSRLLKEEQVIGFRGSHLSERFGIKPSAKGVLIPMVIKDKVAAAVYADVTSEEEDRLDPSSLEILVFATGLLIDTLAIRKKIPAPALREASDLAQILAGTAPPSSPTPTPPSGPSVPFADETIAVPSQALGMGDSGSWAQRADKPAATPPPQPAPEPESQNYATTVMPAFTGQPSPPPTPAPAPPPAPKPAPAPEQQTAAPAPEKPSTQYVPPPGIQRLHGPAAGAPADESRKHDEARRFARLLVSEIKLYNEGKVEQGRKNRDIYERLKEDIDRSRQMYEERVPDEIRKSSNYFYDELVRILADGDADAIGL